MTSNNVVTFDDTKALMNIRSQKKVPEDWQKSIELFEHKYCWASIFVPFSEGYRFKQAQFMMCVMYEKRLVGKVEFRIDGEECEILWILAPDFGRFVMIHLECYLIGSGVKSIKLWYNDEERVAKFYKKCGYDIVETIEKKVCVKKILCLKNNDEEKCKKNPV